MNVLDAADILWETGALLSLTKTYKSRAQSYLKAARLLEDLDSDWRTLPQSAPDDWQSLSEETQQAYQLLVDGETLPLYDELIEAHGNRAADLMRVRGIGPAMAQKIQETIDVWTIEDLEAAIQDGRLLDVSGVGKKTLEQIQTQIEITQETLAAREEKRSKQFQKERLKSQVAQALQQIGQTPKATPEATPEAEISTPPTTAPAKKAAAAPAAQAAPQEKSAESASPAPAQAKATPAATAPSATSSSSTSIASPPPINTDVVRHPIGDVLRSPISHKIGLQQNGSCVEVPGTSERYPVKAGVIDLLNDTKASTESLFQRVMETPLYSRFYEEVFRPGLTRLVTRRSVNKDIQLSVDMLATRPDWGVLDVACGTGNYARAIAKQLDPARGFVLALDVSWPMLERASLLRQKDGLRHMHLVRGDALDLPISDEILEAVHCTAAFHLLPDPDKALREFYRVTRNGGRLVIGTFIQSKRFLPVRLAQKYSSPFTGFRWFDQRELEQRIRNAGFAIQRTDINGLAISIAAEKH